MIQEFSKKYLELLTGEFKGINLTRIESPEEFFQKQIRDSVLPESESEIFKSCLEKTKILVDVGFGGGFPVLPLAFTNPDKKFYGFDARAKKAQAVSAIAERLGLNNVKLMHQRLEEVIFNRDVVITFKAVGKICDLLPLIKTNNKVYVFFYKGPNFYELEDIEPMMKDWEVIEEITYDVSGTEGRLLIGFTNKHVLRGTKTQKNIQFSQLQ